MIEILNRFANKELLKMLLFVLDHADENTPYAEYDLWSAVLNILQTRLQQECDKRNAELGATKGLTNQPQYVIIPAERK